MENIIINEFTKKILAITPKVQKIVLYGSYARGDNTEQSDIDILILLNCTEDECNTLKPQLWKIANEIGYENDKMISLMVRSCSHYEKWKNFSLIYSNIAKDGKVLYGRDAA